MTDKQIIKKALVLASKSITALTEQNTQLQQELDIETELNDALIDTIKNLKKIISYHE